MGAGTVLLTGLDRAAEHSETALRSLDALVDTAIGGARRLEPGVLLAAFPTPAEAVDAALAIQRATVDEPIRVRIGIHAGAVRRCGRVRDIAHGGQTLLSQTAAFAVADRLPEGVRLVDRGLRRLRDLSRPEHVFELRHPDLPGELPPLLSLDELPNNLPAQLTSLVGRGDELLAVERLLAEHRLVTLAGVGGCGKTRLAVHAAAEIADRWPDGTWWVDLGSITDPSLVAAMTAAAMRVLVDPVGDPMQALATQLRSRRLLLCLDTCEHLLDATAKLTDMLLRACPGVSVLATSREPIGVAGETVWRVPSLVEDEAVRLFEERAALVGPEHGFDGTQQESVHTICRQLDGIPLAVELAAAWVRALTPAQIATGLDDRFRLLAGGPRGAVARQRTLAASMEWSHDLLTEADRIVLRRLAVFAGGFTLDAARNVAAGKAIDGADVLALLGELVDKSLVIVAQTEGYARYRLLDTVRQYAELRLEAAGETDEIRDRHLDHYLAFAERAEGELEIDQDRWRVLLEQDRDNIHAALRWGLAAPDPDRGRRLAAAMARQWFIRGQAHEGITFLTDALDRAPDDRSALQARLHTGLAMLGMISGRLELVTAHAERGLEIALASGDDRSRARCLGMAAYREFFHDFERCAALAAEARALAEAAADSFTRDWSLVLDAYSLTVRDRHDEATALARRAFELALPRGDRFLAGFALAVEMVDYSYSKDLRHGVSLGWRVMDIVEPLNDYFAVGTNTVNFAFSRGMSGDLDGALASTEAVSRAVDEVPDVDVVGFMVVLGELHLWSGDLERAVRWFERGTRFADVNAWTALRCLPGLADALRRLGRVDEAAAHADRGATIAERFGAPYVLAEALDQQAFLAARHDPVRAEALHHKALAVRAECQLRPFIADSLDALAHCAAQTQRHAEAVRLLAASDTLRDHTGYPRPPVNLPDHQATLESLRAAMDPDAFTAAWTSGAAMTLDEGIAYATRARGTRGRPSTGWASLTPAELDVVRLVVEGLTNPEIGQRLFMSRSTVKTHLSHVYAKLDVANRTELTRVATQHRP